MPIVDLVQPDIYTPRDTPKGFAVTPGEADMNGSDAPDYGTLAGAAFRQGNEIAALAAADNGSTFTKEDGFNAWDKIKGTKYEKHWDNFADIRNTRDFDLRTQRIDQEETDRKTIEASPWYKSVPLEIAAGIASPTTFLPGGAFYRGAKGGFAIGKTAASVAGASAAATTAQEAMLYGIQETRTIGESAMNVGASVVLGGLLGAAGAKLLSQAEWNGAVKAIDNELAGGSAPIASAKPVYDDVFRQLREAGIPDDEARVNAAVFAARYATRAERLGEGQSAFDAYKADGLEVRTGEIATAEGVGVFAQKPAAIETPEFKNWFGESKVVDDSGGGTFDPNNPRFLYQDASDPRGKITVFKDNSAVIDLFKNKDKSTFMHESGHLWLGEMVRDASKSAGIKADLDATLKWFGVDDASKIELKHHEQWARGFEEYLRDGKAPSAGLAKAFDQFKEWLTAIYRSIAQLGPDHVAISDDIRGVMDRMLATDAEIAATRAGTGAPGSLGAAAATSTNLDANSIYGRSASGVAAATAKLNPLLRALHSPSAVFRDIMLNTVENPLYLKKNFDGVASVPAVETLMKEYNAGLAGALKVTNAAFKEHRKAGGQLSNSEFSDAVGRAMRRSDTSEDPAIAKAAGEWRAKVFDPLKNAAIEAKLLPEDVTVETAASYFTRMWDANKISAKESSFKGVVQEWVAREIPKWAEQYDKGVERRLNPVRQEIADIEMAKLRRTEELKDRKEIEDTGEMSEGDIRQALRIVNGKAPKPKGVKTLSQFVLEAGGLVDDAGELAHRGITNKARPGLIRTERRSAFGKGGGWALDDMARHAWEDGYFPEHVSRPAIDDFVEALNDDFHKLRPVLKEADRDAYKLTEYVNQLEADLSRAGVVNDGKAPKFSTSEGMKGAVERVYKALDAEADQKIAVLKDRLRERETDARTDREARFLDDPRQLGIDIADEVFNTLTGRTAGPRPDFITIKARGPLKERTFNIPDLFEGSNGVKVEDFLESDVEVVGRRYTRVMGADVELARKFGTVDMVDQIAKIREDYAQLRQGITDEKQLRALKDRETNDIGDLEAMRDMLRGTNPGAPADANYSRVVRSINHLNYLRSMGEVAIASLAETIRPAMVHGLGSYMGTLGQTLGNMKGIRLSVGEAQLAGSVSERILGTRLATLSDIVDPYSSRGPVEAFLENMTNVASKWNGIRLLTDMQKSIASVMTQNRLLRGASMFKEVSAKERAYLTFMGIDESMADRIAKQFADHGETVEKVRVANTEKWTDSVAVRTYRAAINKDVDSIITTKGVADTPLFANTPTGRSMLQFKSFALASHQRVLLRGLQEDQARFVGGLIAMSTVGIMATYLKAVSGNRTEKQPQDIGKNPGWWIGEGVDKSGILAIPMELANTFEKATGLNPIKTPLKAYDEAGSISQKNQNRSLMGSIAGPTAGLIDDASSVAGIPKKLITGEDVTQGQKNAGERLLPFNSYLGLRQMLRYVVNPQASAN